MKSITLLGWIVTLVYFVGYAALTIGFGLEPPASLNELGDALAGLFAPLAFLWLIVGFYLQREELRQGTEALKLQALELKNSVDQQTQLVEVTRRQLETEVAFREEELHSAYIEKLPNFLLSLDSVSMSTYDYEVKIKVRNIGKSIDKVELDYLAENGAGDNLSWVPNQFWSFDEGTAKFITLNFKSGKFFHEKYILSFSFLGPEGEVLQQSFSVGVSNDPSGPRVHFVKLGSPSQVEADSEPETE